MLHPFDEDGQLWEFVSNGGIEAAPQPARIRAQITKFQAATGIKNGEMQKLLAVNGNSWNKFMNGTYANQWNAMSNGTYQNAVYFFYCEKKAGAKAIGKTRALAKPSDGAGGNENAKKAFPDLSGVTLEDDHVWQTPGEVRKELRTIMTKYDVSVSSLARAQGLPYQSLLKFTQASDEWAASGNQCYPSAAAIVEKVRLVEGRPKSAKRKALEQEVASGETDRRSGGPNLGMDPNGKYWMMPGARMVKDSLGRHSITYD